MITGGWCLREAVQRHQEREGVGGRSTAHTSQTCWRANSYTGRGLGGLLEESGRLQGQVVEMLH